MTETRCLTVAEVAARYNTTAKHVRGLVQRKMIPHRKFGGVLRFDEAELEEWTKPPQSATSESLLALQHELYPPESAESSRRTRVPMLSGWRWIRKT
jgi:excisionase family DNA binding protein